MTSNAKYKISRPNSLINDSWMGLGNLDELEIENPLMGRTEEEIERPGLLEVSLMRNPEYITFTCKTLLDIDLLPEQAAILYELWTKPFPMYIASRGFGKSFLLAVYAVIKCILYPGTKVVIVGAAFRQSRVIYDYMDTIWKNAPVLRSLCDGDSRPTQAVDRCQVKINDSIAMAVPLGNGDKIRGLRANIIIADEFASIPPDIYEKVVSGFAVVSKDPVDNVKEYYRRKALQAAELWSVNDEVEYREKKGNQSIISGTADYDFKHYADYWKKYSVYIKSQGNLNKKVKLPGGEIKFLKEYFEDSIIPEAFEGDDYCVIRIPYEIIPKGFMDDRVVARAKASMHSAAYQMEYGACFPSDSDGFFRRSLVESCVASDNHPIKSAHGDIWFDCATRGDVGVRHVFGVDPAAEHDNFTVVILALHPDHTRIVSCWSTNMKDFEVRRKAGLTKNMDYYGYCARRIRDLMKMFPTDDIALDAQGGGRAVLEAFHDPYRLEAGEDFLWPTNRILDPDKDLPTDGEKGKHIIHMCQFANADFTSEANHGTRKDFEDKALLFPRFDPLTLELAAHKDAEVAKLTGQKRIYDSLEDVSMEIEDLKDELCTIVMTRTGTGVSGRDRWDTPEKMTPEGKKTRMRKDRYSALVMANYISRRIHRNVAPMDYNAVGGFAHDVAKSDDTNFYQGPEWFTQAWNGEDSPFKGIKRRSGV